MRLPALTLTLFAALAASTASAGPEESRATGGEGRLRIEPAVIDLQTRDDSQRILVIAELAGGRTREITAEAELRLGSEAIARLDPVSHALRPAGDGETTLTARWSGLEVAVPVKVSRAAQPRPVRFELDVIPALTRAGCNSGGCHGASRGKDGFGLSLFGFDPKGDAHRLTRELAGRRINRAVPEASLLLTKAVGAVRHSGGKRFEVESPEYKAISTWIREGAAADPADTPTLTGIELFPSEAVLSGRGDRHQFSVRARYSDGDSRDVTHLAIFLSSNGHSAEVDAHGLVTSGARGEAYIMARYGVFTVGSPVIVRPAEGHFTDWETAPGSEIDALVDAKLRKLRIEPSELCRDDEFLRRVFIDIIGTMPTLEEQRAFLEDTRPDKRERLVDALLGRPEFVDIWVLKWAERLQIRSTRDVSPKAMLGYYNWLRARVAENVPVDAMVRELLTANGGTFTSPATNYYQIERDTLKVSENVAQVFLGMRIQCAQCHNHPFDRWTQDDYYGFAAFFSQIGRKRGADPRETVVFNRGGGEVKHPVTKKDVAPKFLGGAEPDLKRRDRREVLAEWLASKENPAFAANLANMVWEHFFGIGIVNPVDDVRVSNPPSNPQLLATLAERFAATGFDFKAMVRDICCSKTYQRSCVASPANSFDEANFSHARLRRIKAEVLLDIIGQVTQTHEKFQGLPLGARAVEIADGSYSTHFLKIFGRPMRETVCTCEVKMEPTLSQALHLINGATVTRNIQRGGLIAERLKQKVAPIEVVDELYQRTLCRPPTPRERHQLEGVLAAKGDARQTLEDIFWALLNSREFLFNH